MPKFDVVVVGAGNAGLSAALQCQLAGKKTLLIEKHNVPGGAATSFVRGRFEIEPSLHELCDFGPPENPGDVRNILDGYGVKLDWYECKDCFRIVSRYSDGMPMDVTMPSGIDAFIDKMEEYVPGSREKMTQLFDLFQEVLDGIAYITASKGHADSKVLQADYPNMLRTGAYSTKKVFNALKLPLKCQDILSTYWSYLGVDMEHLASAHTSHQLSTAMVERFREVGGQVWVNCRAEEFLFEGDRLCGVRTNLGVIDCDYCLANINPDIIYGKMMPKELIPEREKKLSAARGRIMGGRMYTAYFCLDASPEELGIRDYSIFLSGSADSANEYQRIQGGMKTNDYSIFLCYNIANPEFSVPGTCVCSFTTFGAPDEWGSLSQEEYFRFKTDGAKKMLRNLKVGVPEGSVYGYETRDWDGMMARMMMLGSDYPIKGLRPIGAAGPRGDGYSATIICGQLMAANALRDLKEWEGGTGNV